MAHWIIEDHGFGGLYYKCSECGEFWWDILEKVSMEDRCPNCNSIINEDETEYVDHLFGLSKTTVRAGLQRYCELETKLIQLTGFNLEKLVELFAAGYTLQSPKHSGMEDLEKECE